MTESESTEVGRRDRSETAKAGGRPDATPSATRRRPSKLKLWCFRLAAVSLAALLLVIVEVLLIAFGVGQDTSFYLSVPGKPKLLPYQVNPHAESAYFSGREVAGPEPRRFALPRPEGVYRVVVVGASTVLGFPYPPELAFPRQLEVLLNHQNSGPQFEVINAGIVAINTLSVADVVKQAVALQPDLIVVHAGHNEFYGPGGVASTAVEPPTVYPFVLMIRRQRLFQLINSGLHREAEQQGHLIESLPQSVVIPLDGPQFVKAELSYRRNLTRMVHTATSAGIPVLLTTVASNLSGHSPVSFLVPEGLGPEEHQRWKALFDQGRALSGQQQWAAAIDEFDRARAISEDSSLLHYRRGQCLEALERFPAARQAFERARDLDGCRFRAPGSFQRIVHEVADQFAAPQVWFLDTAEQLVEQAGPRALGSNLFLEHVHYNLHGHRLLALAVGRFIQETVRGQNWDSDRIPAEPDFDRLLGLLPEDRLSGLSSALRLMDVFPMNQTFDANSHRQELVSRIREALDQLEPEQQQVFADLSLDDMALRLPEALADHYRRTGETEREHFYRQVDAIRRPWNAEVRFQLARCLAESGQVAEARDECRQTLALSPAHPGATELGGQLGLPSKPRL